MKMTSPRRDPPSSCMSQADSIHRNLDEAFAGLNLSERRDNKMLTFVIDLGKIKPRGDPLNPKQLYAACVVPDGGIDCNHITMKLDEDDRTVLFETELRQEFLLKPIDYVPDEMTGNDEILEAFEKGFTAVMKKLSVKKTPTSTPIIPRKGSVVLPHAAVQNEFGGLVDLYELKLNTRVCNSAHTRILMKSQPKDNAGRLVTQAVMFVGFFQEQSDEERIEATHAHRQFNEDQPRATPPAAGRKRSGWGLPGVGLLWGG